ncbi:MAG: thiamine phosphate synthase [Pseudomonadota bacterium]
MRRRHPPIPAIWLMTDARMGEELWAALDRLPRGAGVVVRHYGLDPRTRRFLIRRVAKVARKKNLTLVIAGGNQGFAHAGVHNGRGGARTRLRTESAHSRREAVAAARRGADAVFVSPVFATRSHPGARALGPVRFGLMARELGVPVIALGGMDAKRGRRLRGLGASGWAAIDAWL